jgi:subtilisin family serine protease
MRTLLRCLPCLVAAFLPVPAETRAQGARQLAVKTSPADQGLFRAFASKSVPAERLERFALYRKADRLYGILFAEFEDEASGQRLNVRGVHVFHRWGRFADLFVEPDPQIFTVLTQVPGLRWIDFAGPVMLGPQIKPEKGLSRELSQGLVRGGVAGLTGKGVIVAIIDSGIDFRHPDFITRDSTDQPVSRLLYFWDTLDGSRGQSGPRPSIPTALPLAGSTPATS